MSESTETQWLEFESPWACQPGKVRVLQSAGDVSRDELVQRAWRDELARPYIFETPFERRMHFTNEATQSAMLLSDPNALISQYTRKMMAFLLFNPNPQRIVMIGLGGGSLAKFCYRHLPRSHITVVEINEDVIALREEFCIPKANIFTGWSSRSIRTKAGESGFRRSGIRRIRTRTTRESAARVLLKFRAREFPAPCRI